MRSASWKLPVLICLLVACPKVPSSPDSEAMAHRIAELVVSGNSNSIAAEFYYPERSPREREADRKGVESLLNVVFDDYGTVAEITRLDAIPPSIFTMVASGDVKFLNAHAYFTRYPYRARFSKRGDGYVFVDIMRINQHAALRSVSFALPSTRPEAAALIESTSKRMLSVLTETVTGR
jgi:hypothetical protein